MYLDINKFSNFIHWNNWKKGKIYWYGSIIIHCKKVKFTDFFRKIEVKLVVKKYSYLILIQFLRQKLLQHFCQQILHKIKDFFFFAVYISSSVDKLIHFMKFRIYIDKKEVDNLENLIEFSLISKTKKVLVKTNSN